jgi:molybdopterin-containing oxidoreductase family membrane subunit
METFRYRALGDYTVMFWIMISCNSLIPLTLFVRRLRRNVKYLFVLSLFVNVGMWVERFVIIVTSLARDYDPYVWGTYTPSIVEVGITLGSFGLFFTAYLLFLKTLPVLSITEIKEHL